jgi:hypothetical protein
MTTPAAEADDGGREGCPRRIVTKGVAHPTGAPAELLRLRHEAASARAPGAVIADADAGADPLGKGTGAATEVLRHHGKGVLRAGNRAEHGVGAEDDAGAGASPRRGTVRQSWQPVSTRELVSGETMEEDDLEATRPHRPARLGCSPPAAEEPPGYAAAATDEGLQRIGLPARNKWGHYGHFN